VLKKLEKNALSKKFKIVIFYFFTLGRFIGGFSVPIYQLRLKFKIVIFDFFTLRMLY